MDSSNAPAFRVQPPVLDNAVIFLFAHQQIVFRYPLTNPFEVAPSYNSRAPLSSQGVDGDTDGPPGPSSLSQTLGGNAGSAASGSAGGATSTTPSSAAPKMPTCVGLDLSTIVFLLRNSYSRLTTLRIGMCSFLVWPLYGVKGEATLVVALGQPDDAYAHVTRFVQVCVNVLLREETRCAYVTRSIDAMLAAIEAAGAPRSAAAVAAAEVTTAQTPFTPHRKGVRLSDPSSVAAVSLQPTGVGELDAMDRAAHAAQGGLFVELRLIAETVNGQYHQDILVNQLLVVPHSHMSGHVRHRRQVVASFSSRFHSGSVVTIADPYFADTRRQQYEHVVGKDIVELLPLDDIERLMLQLAPPWTLFALRSGLERRLTERIVSNRPSASGGIAPPPHIARYTPPLSSGGGSADDGDSVYSAQDAPFIVFEVIEFLRLFGAITIHVQHLAMTRGRLAKVLPQVSPGTTPQRGGGARLCSSLLAPATCILGPTCVDCEVQLAADKACATSGGATSPLSDGDASVKTALIHTPTVAVVSANDYSQASTEVQHQLLYRHYNSVYDDPWFVASEVEHRVLESNLELPHNKHPSLRVFERKFEQMKLTAAAAPNASPASNAPHLFSGLHSPLSSSLNGTRTSVDLDAMHHQLNSDSVPQTAPTQDPSQWKEQVSGIHRPTDVPPAAAAWLCRHSDEIRRRASHWLRATAGINGGSSAPLLHLGGGEHPVTSGRRHQRTDSQLSHAQDDNQFVIDSQGSLTRRRFYEPPRKDGVGAAPPSVPAAPGNASAPAEYPNDPRLLPDETLLRLVVHLVVTFLWQAGDEVSSGGSCAGGEGGFAATSRADPPPAQMKGSTRGGRHFPSMDDLTAKVEWSLRHIAPTLRNMTYARLRQEAVIAHQHQVGALQRVGHPDHDPEVHTAEGEHPPPSLTIAERKILEMTATIEALHLLDDVKPFAGREIRRIPCRRLVHVAVNLIPDVVAVVLMPSKLPSAAAI
jgi:hypothetical protein